MTEYKALDGRSFDSRKEGELYDLYLDHRRLDCKQLYNYPLPAKYINWYKIVNEFQIEMLKKGFE